MAEQNNKPQIPRVKLGNQGLEVSKLGFGCMSLTGAVNSHVPQEEVNSIIRHAFNSGVTFFDPADVYGGSHANNTLIGKALKQLPREKVEVATKFGISRREVNNNCLTVNGSPEYVRSCIEASLKHLDVDYIDLYYLHRVDKTVPIEDTMGELKKLVEEGKIKYIGLSNHNVHKKSSQCSSNHSPANGVVSLESRHRGSPALQKAKIYRELGIGKVAYSPLGRGFFGGKAVVESLPANSVLASHPRYQGENLSKNKSGYHRVEALAKKHNCSTAHLALTWVLQQGHDVVPTPGTTQIKNLDDIIGSVSLRLSEEDLREICEAVPVEEVFGSRFYNGTDTASWKLADTPTQ